MSSTGVPRIRVVLKECGPMAPMTYEGDVWKTDFSRNAQIQIYFVWSSELHVEDVLHHRAAFVR